MSRSGEDIAALERVFTAGATSGVERRAAASKLLFDHAAQGTERVALHLRAAAAAESLEGRSLHLAMVLAVCSAIEDRREQHRGEPLPKTLLGLVEPLVVLLARRDAPFQVEDVLNQLGGGALAGEFDAALESLLEGGKQARRLAATRAVARLRRLSLLPALQSIFFDSKQALALRQAANDATAQMVFRHFKNAAEFESWWKKEYRGNSEIELLRAANLRLRAEVGAARKQLVSAAGGNPHQLLAFLEDPEFSEVRGRAAKLLAVFLRKLDDSAKAQLLGEILAVLKRRVAEEWVGEVRLEVIDCLAALALLEAKASSPELHRMLSGVGAMAIALSSVEEGEGLDRLEERLRAVGIQRYLAADAKVPAHIATLIADIAQRKDGIAAAERELYQTYRRTVLETACALTFKAPLAEKLFAPVSELLGSDEAEEVRRQAVTLLGCLGALEPLRERALVRLTDGALRDRGVSVRNEALKVIRSLTADEADRAKVVDAHLELLGDEAQIVRANVCDWFLAALDEPAWRAALIPRIYAPVAARLSGTDGESLREIRIRLGNLLVARTDEEGISRAIELLAPRERGSVLLFARKAIAAKRTVEERFALRVLAARTLIKGEHHRAALPFLREAIQQKEGRPPEGDAHFLEAQRLFALCAWRSHARLEDLQDFPAEPGSEARADLGIAAPIAAGLKDENQVALMRWDIFLRLGRGEEVRPQIAGALDRSKPFDPALFERLERMVWLEYSRGAWAECNAWLSYLPASKQASCWALRTIAVHAWLAAAKGAGKVDEAELNRRLGALFGPASPAPSGLLRAQRLLAVVAALEGVAGVELLRPFVRGFEVPADLPEDMARRIAELKKR